MVKMVLLGGGVGGKSALIHRYLHDAYMDEIDSTFEASYNKHTVIDGKNVTLVMNDTPGQEEYSSIITSWLREAQGVMLVYRINDRESLMAMVERDLLHLCFTELGNGAPILLVGSWCDKEAERVISREEGQKFAEKNGLQFIETSSFTGQNVNLAFETLARMILKRNESKMELSAKKKSA